MIDSFSAWVNSLTWYGHYLIFLLSLSYAISLASLSKIAGIKAAELQELWSDRRIARRTFDVAVLLFIALIVGITSTLLALAREWAAGQLGKIPKSSIPPVEVLYAFCAVGMFAFVVGLIFFYYVYQNRCVKVHAYHAWKREYAAFQKTMKKKWLNLAKKRNGLITEWDTKHCTISSAALLKISRYNYAIVDSNYEGKSLPNGFLNSTPENCLPSAVLPEKIDLDDYLSTPHAIDLLKMVNGKGNHENT